MEVHGPHWPSTAALREALASVQSTKAVHWGIHSKDGLEQLQLFQKAGLRCPPFTDNLDEAKKWVREGHEVFGRRRRHTHGSDIVGSGSPDLVEQVAFVQSNGKPVAFNRLKPGSKWNRRWLCRQFWTRFIPSVEEFRQHIWDGKAIRVGKKVQTGESWRKLLVRSRGNGWTIDYSYQSSGELREDLRCAAKMAVKTLGYVGGAVDILRTESGELYVLEVNSAPSLRDSNTLLAYVKAIKKWARK